MTMKVWIVWNERENSNKSTSIDKIFSTEKKHQNILKKLKEIIFLISIQKNLKWINLENSKNLSNNQIHPRKYDIDFYTFIIRLLI